MNTPSSECPSHTDAVAAESKDASSDRTLNALLFSGGERLRLVVGGFQGKAVPKFATRSGWTGRLARKLYEAYEAFRERFDYQETVCALLGHADALVVLHPQRLHPEAARVRFNQYLEQEQAKHSNWMMVDAVLALLGSLLTPIPGPNVFFLYPAARAVSHYLAQKGTTKVRQLEMLCYTPDPVLDKVEQNLKNLDAVLSEIEELQRRYGFEDLRSLLERL